MSQDITIRFKGDKTQAQAERQALHQEIKRIEAIEQADFEKIKNAEMLAIKAGNQERLRLADEALAKESAGWGQMLGQVQLVQGAVAQVGTALIGVGSVGAVIAVIGENFKRIRDEAVESVGALQEFRTRLLELQALKGTPGETSSGVLADLEFRSQTLQTPAAATSMQTAFLGVAESSIDTAKMRRLMTPDEARNLSIMVGKFQAAEGGDPTAYGRLGGMMPRIMNTRGVARPTADQSFQEMAALYEIARPGGFEWSSAVSQFGKAMPYISSGILDDRTAMAIQSAFSITEPENAATRLDQLMRATVGATGRDRKIRAPEGTDVVGTGTYLQSLGLNASDGPVAITQAIMADLKKQGITGAAQIPYLQSRGFGNAEDLQALIGFGGILGDGTWQNTFAPMLGDKDLGQGRGAEISGRLGADPVFQMRRADLNVEMAKLKPGLENEALLTTMKTVWARLKQQPGNEGMPDVDTVFKSWDVGSDNFFFGYRNQLMRGTEDMLRHYGKPVGVDVPRLRPGQDPSMVTQYGSVWSDKELAAFANRVRGAGGFAGMEAETSGSGGLVEATRNLAEAAGTLSRSASGSWDPPLQGNPTPVPPSAGGGW